MKVLLVTPAFYPATYWGGPIYSTYGLCNSLAQLPEISLKVLTTNSAGPTIGDKLRFDLFPVRLPAGYEVYYCRRVLGKSFAPSLFLRLWKMIRWADVVHLNAVYSPPTIPTLLVCKLLTKPVVWSPRGALQRWNKTTRQKAKRMWEEVCNSLCEPKRVTLHVTSDQERVDSCKRIARAQVVVVPNGMDIAETHSIGKQAKHDGRFHLLYLGRLHPIKGIENLLQAMVRMPPEVLLTICGEGVPTYRRLLESLVSELELQRRVQLTGHITDEKKSQQFTQSDVCIVPSFSENFGMVVLESLSHGVPVIASTGTPWKSIEDIGCGLWVDNSPESLSEATRRIQLMPCQEMGQKGREWVRQEFSWEHIAYKMMQVYQELVARNL